MDLERRALYNLLRMNWLQDDSMEVESWQVADYRSWNDEELLEVISEVDEQINQRRFMLFADQCDSPEELMACFVDEDTEPELEDRVYLAAFELWRRWSDDKPSLSIFCDELDHRIWAHDLGEEEDDEPLQDAIEHLINIIEDGVDDGGDPQEVFANVAAYCANDLESVLYDYAAEQLEVGNEQYVSELIESFLPYFSEIRWLKLLEAALLADTDIEKANTALREATSEGDPSLEFHLEVLDFMTHTGDRDLFIDVAKATIPLIESEEEFLDLLNSCANYYGCLDSDSQEQAVENIIERREDRNLEDEFDSDDLDVETLLTLLNRRVVNHR